MWLWRLANPTSTCKPGGWRPRQLCEGRWKAEFPLLQGISISVSSEVLPLTRRAFPSCYGGLSTLLKANSSQCFMKCFHSNITLVWDQISGLLLLLFRCPVMSDSLWSHGLQHARPPCPSPSPRVCPSSWSLDRWCCPAISSSDTLFSSCPQSFPESGTFPMRHLFTPDDQNTGASTSASVLSVNLQGWSPLRSTGVISLLPKGLSGVFSSTTVQRHQFLGTRPSLWSNSHNLTWPLGRP